jgi:hypothetical protein
MNRFIGDRHVLSLNGQNRQVGRSDILRFAEQGDIRHAASILEEIKDVVSDFRTVVSDMGIEDSVRDVIDKHIQRQVQYLDHSD